MPMTARILEREFVARAISHSGGLLMLQTDDALALVLRAEEERIPILGVDGFIVAPHRTMSPIEHIVDYSNSVSDELGNWSDAWRFIQQRRNMGLVFEITLG